MASLRTLHTGKEVSNNSKGNGTVMRCAPIAVWAKAKRISPTSAQLLSRRDAEITHKHPYAAESSSLLVGIYLRLFSGTPFRVAVALEVQSQVEAGLVSWPVAALCLAAVDPCLNFSEFSTRHTSFIAEGTLAVALAAVAKSASFLEAVVLAASTPGDSDTIAAVAGGLAVAVGYKVPAKYSSRLNVAPVLDYMEKTYQ
jgi:ADP-ribosylglycohydrolase